MKEFLIVYDNKVRSTHEIDIVRAALKEDHANVYLITRGKRNKRTVKLSPVVLEKPKKVQVEVQQLTVGGEFIG